MDVQSTHVRTIKADLARVDCRYVSISMLIQADSPHLSPHPVSCPAEASRSSSAFGGAQFWNALRSEDKLEGEVRGLFAGVHVLSTLGRIEGGVGTRK